MDMLYIENCSLVRDLQILFQTLAVVFIPESTEGFAVERLSEMERDGCCQNSAAPAQEAREEEKERSDRRAC